MSKTVYLKIRQLTKTDKQDVYLSDVAEVYAEKKLLPKIKSIKLATFYRTKKDRICISSMQVISAIQQLDDTLDVNNIGESDFIIDYRTVTALRSSGIWSASPTRGQTMKICCPAAASFRIKACTRGR